MVEIRKRIQKHNIFLFVLDQLFILFRPPEQTIYPIITTT